MSMPLIPYLLLLLFSISIKETCGYASRNGEVTITKDTEGFYVEVDLAENASLSSKMAKMILSLTNSQTTLPASTCLGFDSYNCGEFKCSPGASFMTVEYPHLSAPTKPATLEAILDYSNWILKTDAFLTQTCVSPGNSLYGQKRGGVIGMGTDGNAKNSYIGSQIFSISLNKDLTGGKLLWKYDSSLASSSSPTVLSANSQWRVLLGDSSAKLNVGTNSISLTGNLVFDINSDAIGFPFAIYKTIINNLENITKIFCSDKDKSLYLPRCQLYSNSIAELPTLTIAIGSTIISIPSSIYAQPEDKLDWVTLNLKAIGSEYSGKNYVTNSFQNSIILDVNFMNYYYTVFDSTSNNQIKLYARGSNNTSESSNTGSRIWIWVIIAIVLVAVSFFVFVSKRKTAASSKTAQEGSRKEILVQLQTRN